jgi:hypothetical protein
VRREKSGTPLLVQEIQRVRGPAVGRPGKEQVREVKLLYVALAALLVAGIAQPAPAAAQGALPYSLMLNATTYTGATPAGTISGTFGGVPVTGTYGDTHWMLLVYGRPFATGRYRCIHVCRFRGETLAGNAMSYEWTSQVPTWDARVQAAVGNINGLFLSNSDWTGQVSSWAQANGLPADQQTRLMIATETGM